ncbi:hypothetical protein DYB28_000613 [Aphanomyces astaci]|uniref:Uncharacterized protein n=1 Tax=Aphanomyces astaci TaxID=112090 RepID=A0A9X8H2Z8_APHAT|nr:hypothetical protein DYB28_000613 [Aphanomyces astaci]
MVIRANLSLKENELRLLLARIQAILQALRTLFLNMDFKLLLQNLMRDASIVTLWVTKLILHKTLLIQHLQRWILAEKGCTSVASVVEDYVDEAMNHHP